MIAFAQPVRCTSPADIDSHDLFLAMLPKIHRYARAKLRYYAAEAREDAIAEITANAFKAYIRLVERGKLDVVFATALARFAIRQFQSGRRVGNRFTIRDVMSTAAQRRGGFTVERLDCVDPDTGEWIDAIADDFSTPVPDQAAFRCDFPAWLRMQKPRNRRIAEALSLGHTTAEVAKRFRISAGRISQLRSELQKSWRAFHGEVDAEEFDR